MSGLRAVGALLAMALLATGLAAAGLAAAPPAAAQQTTPCDQESNTSYAKVTRAPRYGFRPQQVVSIPSDLDGVAIQMAIVRPDVPPGTRVPVILRASSYYHPLQDIDARACKPFLTENFVPQGYAVALLAVRGTGDSGGCMNLFGSKERYDIDQAVTWLGEQPWSSGAVGMTGKSYDGGTQWEAASLGNPHLKTIVPASGVPDVFKLLFGAGTADWRGPLVLNDIYYAQSVAFYAQGRSAQSTREVLACPEYVDAQVATTLSALTGEHDPLGYWADRRFLPEVEQNYRGSILLVQGLADWNVNPGQQFPWVNDLVAQSSLDGGDGIAIKYMLGQWGHSDPDTAGGNAKRPDWADILLDWYDYWLKGDTKVDLGPVAEVQDSSGAWRAADSWPPAGTTTPLWLTPDGGLAAAPSQSTGSGMVTLDPLHTQGGSQTVTPPEPVGSVCQAPSCLRFQTSVFSEPFRFAGLPQLKLSVTPQGPGGQLSAYLYAVGTGAPRRIGWGQVDLRFPRGEVDQTPKARAVEPGKPMLVNVALQPLDTVVPAGSRLVLVVSEGTAYNRLPTLPNFPIEIRTGGESSSLTVNVVNAAAEDFFVPGVRTPATG